MLLSLILFVIMSVVAAYIASNNLAPMQVNLLGYPLTGPTGMVLVVAFGAGVLLGVVIMLPALISRSWAVIRHRRKLQDIQDAQDRQMLKHKQVDPLAAKEEDEAEQ